MMLPVNAKEKKMCCFFSSFNLLLMFCSWSIYLYGFSETFILLLMLLKCKQINQSATSAEIYENLPLSSLPKFIRDHNEIGYVVQFS